jgi:hypothetical protein
VLVPLTSSLYVPGLLDPKERVLVDIGTSFYVGKSAGDAKELLAKKAAQLKENTDTLMKVILVKRSAWVRARSPYRRARTHTSRFTNRGLPPFIADNADAVAEALEARQRG